MGTIRIRRDNTGPTQASVPKCARKYNKPNGQGESTLRSSTQTSKVQHRRPRVDIVVKPGTPFRARQKGPYVIYNLSERR
jgi:hypothetical protein